MANKRIRRAFPSVRAWMRATATNQQELAKVLNISQSHLCNVLRGNRKPSLDLAFKIAQLTNVPVENIDQTARVA